MRGVDRWIGPPIDPVDRSTHPVVRSMGLHVPRGQVLRGGGKPKQRELTNNGLLRVQIDSSQVESHLRQGAAAASQRRRVAASQHHSTTASQHHSTTAQLWHTSQCVALCKRNCASGKAPAARRHCTHTPRALHAHCVRIACTLRTVHCPPRPQALSRAGCSCAPRATHPRSGGTSVPVRCQVPGAG